MEAVDERAFTQVLQADKGRNVRADFVVTAHEHERVLRFEQDLIGTPFEGLLRYAETVVELVPLGDASVTVTLTITRKLRGLARFGGVIMQRGIDRKSVV